MHPALAWMNESEENMKNTVKQSCISDNPFLSKVNNYLTPTSSAEPNNTQCKSSKIVSQGGKKSKNGCSNYDKILKKAQKSVENTKTKRLGVKKKLRKTQIVLKGKLPRETVNQKGKKNQCQTSEGNSGFLATYNMVKIQNPKLLASRAAKLNMVKQSLLNIEHEKNAKGSTKERGERCCDDCGTPLSTGRDFIMHRDKCEIRQKKLEKILSELKLPMSIQSTPQKESLACEGNDRASSSEPNDEMKATPSPGTANKASKSPFRTLYNLYDGLNKEHIDIMLSSSSRNKRTLRSRGQDGDLMSPRTSRNLQKNFAVDNSQNEILITTRIKGNVIERKTLIKTKETVAASGDITDDEGQVNSRSMYETLKNSCQVSDTSLFQNEKESPPRRQLISDCPQGLPRLANIRKLLKRNVLNPIRRKGSILQDAKKIKQDRRNASIEKDVLKSSKKKANVAVSVFNKSRGRVKKVQNKNFTTSWQVEETDKRQERMLRATMRAKNIELLDSSSQLTGSSSKLTGSSSQLTGSSSKLTGSSSQLTGSSSQLTGSSSKLTGSPSQLSGSSSKLTGSSSKLTDSSSKLTDSSSKLTGSSSKLTGSSSQLSGSSSQEDEIKKKLQTSRMDMQVPSTGIEPKKLTSSSCNLFVPYDLTKQLPDKAQQAYREKHKLAVLSKRRSVPNTASTSNSLQHGVTPPSESPKSTTPKSLEQILLKQEILEELKKLENRKWCDVCKKPFANGGSLNLHFTSTAHKKRVESSLFGGLQDGKKTPSVEKKEQQKRIVGKRKSQGPPKASKREEVENICDEEGNVEPAQEVREEAIRSQTEANRGQMEANRSQTEANRRQTLSPAGENTPRSGVKRTRRSSVLTLGPILGDSEPALEEDKESISPQAKDMESTSPQVKDMESTSPQAKDMESTSPQAKDMESTSPQAKDKESTSPQAKDKESTSPQVKDMESTSPQAKDKRCDTCNVSFLSDVQLQKHLSSKMHRTAVALIADGKPKVCSVCNVSFSVNSQLHKHFATPTHKQAAAKLVDQLEERGVIKTALFT